MFILGVSNNDASKFCEGAYLAKTCTQRNPHDDIIDQATTATSKQTLRGSTSLGRTPCARLMLKVPLHTLPPDSDTPGRPPRRPDVGAQTFRHPDVGAASASHASAFRHPNFPTKEGGAKQGGAKRSQMAKLDAGRQCTCTILHATATAITSATTHATPH